MIRALISLFLFINCFIGLLFYEDTTFGHYLASSDWLSGGFVISNFLLSNVIIIFLRSKPFVIASLLLLTGFLLISILGLTIFLSYYIIFEYFNANDENPFFWIIIAIIEIAIFVKTFRPILIFILSAIEEIRNS